METMKQPRRPGPTTQKIKESMIQSDSVVVMSYGVNGKVKVLDTPAKKRKHLTNDKA
jgi:hypothetical protein